MSAPVVDLAEPRRTSALAIVFGIGSPDQMRALVPAVVVAFSSGFVLYIALALLVFLVVRGLLSWWRRTWSFDGEVLHLDEGVLVRNQRRIPVERIQHVEIERRLRHQLFGLSGIRVETAGGAGAELRLDAIAEAEAEALRSGVLDALRPASGTTDHDDGAIPPPPAPPPEVLVKLPPRRLLLSGITGPEVAAILAALAVLFDTAIDVGLDPSEVDEVRLTSLAIALVVVVAVPVWLGSAAVVGLVRRWDLTAVIDGDEVRVTYGLLRKAEFVVKTPRVQDVRISRRVLLRPFGRADLRIRTAASGQGDSSRVDIPLLDDDEIDRILRRVLPEATPLPPLLPAPTAARRRSLLRGGFLGLAVAALVSVLAAAAVGPSGLALLVAGPCVGVALGESAYRALGVAYGQDSGVVHSGTGVVGRHRAIVAERRVQSGAVESTWFQRRRRLASVRLDLAGAAISVVDRSESEATDVVATAV